ncbi:ran-binding protein [Poronia punctata]|nr:ran-binding protein [Poronia punctata]
MANPFQHGSSGIHPDSTSHGFRLGASYASIVSGSNLSLTSPSMRSNRVSYLLNPTNDSTSDLYSTLASSRSSIFDPEDNDHVPSGHGPSPASRPPQVPSFSRAFELFMPRRSTEMQWETIQNKAFFVPSYLKGSSYITELEDIHRTKQLEAESRRQVGGGVPMTSPMLPQGLKPPVSHMGMTFDLIERNPVSEHPSTVPPLPTRWNKDDKYGPVEVSANGLEVKLNPTKAGRDQDHEVCLIRSDHAMPVVAGIYYFEITLLSKRRDDISVSVGFLGKNVVLSRPPGWEPESWGFHGDDGEIYAGGNIGKKYKDTTFSANDVIGCGVNFRTGQAFFTKNGANLGVAFRDIRGKLYPVVGMKRAGEQVRANFGQSPFAYKIDEVVENERVIVQNAISRTSIEKLAPSLSETELIQKLVMQFLQHDGYVETAREFANELLAEQQALSSASGVPVENIAIKDNDDAHRRQRIRRAILEGDIDQALELIHESYPRVLEKNQDVCFKLKCRKFIEMVRKAAEYDTSHVTETNGTGHSYEDTPNEMDIDESDPSAGMEYESRETEPRMDANLLLHKTIEYGQALQAEFKNDTRREVTKTLEDIFALLAYPNPLKVKECQPLLDRRGRTAVAEELNSAILSSLGKSSRSALENMYAQTSVLLDYLREDGGPGSLISLRSVIEEIPRSHQY